MSAALPFGAAFFFSSVLGLGYDLSIAAGVVLFVSLIVALWFYSFQPLEVKAESIWQPTAFGRVQSVTRKKDERLVYFAFQPVKYSAV